MFPDDSICNVKTAKSAARRIFEKYVFTSSKSTQSKGLGHQQVAGLIKNAYSAINMDYDPSLNDVSSFMSVFGVGQNGIIGLDKLQELAVKYLCGEEIMKVQSDDPYQKDSEIKITSKVESEVVTRNANKKPSIEKKAHYQNLLQRENTGKEQSFQISEQHNNNLDLNFSRTHQTKNFFSSNQNNFSQQKCQKIQQVKNSKKPTQSELLNQANQIFNEEKNKEKLGITIQQAAKVITKTYLLVKKMKFMPSEKDIDIWMKLCDLRKNGVVEWVSYENFVKKMMERQKILKQNCR